MDDKELKEQLKKAKAKVYRKKHYHEVEKHNRASTATGRTTRIYRCPMCKFNVQKLSQLGNHGLRVQERIYGGRANIKVVEAPITPEYIEAVKLAIRELTSDPPQ